MEYGLIFPRGGFVGHFCTSEPMPEVKRGRWFTFRGTVDGNDLILSAECTYVYRRNGLTKFKLVRQP